MGYIGNQTSNSYSSLDKQTITGDGGASYTLTHAGANAQEIEVFVNNVRQEPGVAYTVSGTALTMTGNVASTDDFYVVFQGKALQTTVPPDDSVTTARINDGAVTNAKIDTMAASKLTGALPAIDGSSLTGINSGFTWMTAQNASGTNEVDFTGIPSGVNVIRWTGWQISQASTSVTGIRIGDSGGIETSGYFRQDHYIDTSTNQGGATNTSSSAWTNNSWTGDSNSFIYTGEIIHAGSNRWILNARGFPEQSGAYWVALGGTKELSGELDRVRFFCETGNFDAGQYRLGYMY